MGVSDATWITSLLVVALFVSALGTYTAVSKLSVTGLPAGTTQANVAASTVITLPVSTINFGSVTLNSVDDTEDNTPPPFQIQNDGNVNVNITIGATALWAGTGAAVTSSYYQFKSAENESGSVVNATADLVTTWTNIPISPDAAVKFATNVKFANANDLLNGHVKITVPSDEPAGAKTSTVTFTASQA